MTVAVRYSRGGDKMKPRFIIAIKVITRFISADRISESVRLKPSHVLKRNESNHLGKKWRKTSWHYQRFGPKSGQASKLVLDALSNWPRDAARKLKEIDQECEVFLIVSCVHDTYTASCVLSHEAISAAAERGMSILFSSYPGSEMEAVVPRPAGVNSRRRRGAGLANPQHARA